MIEQLNIGVAGIEVDYLEWKSDLLPGVYVELIERGSDHADLSELYVKPGTALELDEIEFLESKIAL